MGNGFGRGLSLVGGLCLWVVLTTNQTPALANIPGGGDGTGPERHTGQ